MSAVLTMQNKCVVYTGAAGLIGQACVKGLARNGATLALIDPDKPRLEAFIQSLNAEFPAVKVLGYSDIDTLDAKSIDGAFAQIVQHTGKIDCLVNCAYPRTKDWSLKFEDIPFESLTTNLASQLGGYFLMCQRAATVMTAQKFGNIINFGSIYGMVGPDFQIYPEGMTMPAAYSGIKGGVVTLTRYLASYLGPNQIRVNAICPGGVFDSQNPEFVRRYEHRTPLRRMATPEDIVGPLLFLASDLSEYLTGVVLPVDGGWTAI